MRGLFLLLWPLYLLLVFALLSPLEVSVGARLTPRGGYGEAAVRFMTVRVRIPFRVTLLDRPFLTLERIHKDGGGKRLLWPGMEKKPRSPMGAAALAALEDTEINALWIAGAGDAAVTALLCGLLKSVTELGISLLPFPVDSRTEALPRWDGPVLRLDAAGIARVKLAEIIRRVLWMRSEKGKWRIPWKPSCTPPSQS